VRREASNPGHLSRDRHDLFRAALKQRKGKHSMRADDQIDKFAVLLDRPLEISQISWKTGYFKRYE